MSFKVIIIGGSVTGLTLANILERYGIEYVLLEKYRCIAPQLGASLAILPYGSQVLDQLGVNEAVQSMCERVESMHYYSSDGVKLGSHDTFGEMLLELTGYTFDFLDRQELVQILYDNLQDKSKVHVSKGLSSIGHLDTGVTVTTEDGTIFTGDILVGADGVHSQTRKEMWRIADSEVPDYGTQQMAKSITCSYKCMFGISDRPEGFPDGRGYKTYHKNRSYVYQAGRGGKMYFFAFSKNPEVTIDNGILQYTAEDENALVDVQRDDVLFPGLTFGDLYRKCRTAALVPLQEYVLEKCFYKRVVLIGDSFHKMNPLTGQGGNSAIEDAALLGDLLKEALDNSPRPANETIHAKLAYFQEERKPRTKILVDGAHALQRLEALENPFLEFLLKKVIVKGDIAQLAAVMAATHCPGHTLKYLPKPSREGIVARDVEVIARPRDRSSVATAFWIILVLLVVGVSIVLGQSVSIGTATVLRDSLLDYTLVTAMGINALWTIESHRPGLAGEYLCSSIPYIFASTVFGWHLITPIYFAIYIYLSQSRPFYYPNPRAIDLRAAEFLPTGLLVTYIVLALLVLKNTAPVEIRGWILSLVQLVLPILVSLGQRLSTREPPSSDFAEALYGTRDMPYLSRFYNLEILATSTLHIVIASRVFPHLSDAGVLKEMVLSSEGVQLGCLIAAILIWCIFTNWDLRRTNVLQAPLFLAIPAVLLGSACFGPAAALIGLWKWREGALDRSRARK